MALLTVDETRKATKVLWFRAPMQFPTQKQWWSNSRTQLSQYRQCELRGGRRTLQVVQSLRCRRLASPIRPPQNCSAAPRSSTPSRLSVSCSKRSIAVCSAAEAWPSLLPRGGLQRSQYIFTRRRISACPEGDAVIAANTSRRGRMPGSLRRVSKNVMQDATKAAMATEEVPTATGHSRSRRSSRAQKRDMIPAMMMTEASAGQVREGSNTQP
mmetsp:Transcript_19864/g.40367  ORF Transcript_19864/g.40367 Transcript_19864/m.40367 type:complete len:213 (-) Transcript_19864:97-735(-)